MPPISTTTSIKSSENLISIKAEVKSSTDTLITVAQNKANLYTEPMSCHMNSPGSSTTGKFSMYGNNQVASAGSQATAGSQAGSGYGRYVESGSYSHSTHLSEMSKRRNEELLSSSYFNNTDINKNKMLDKKMSKDSLESNIFTKFMFQPFSD